MISACRKVHTESSKKWLDRLQVEKVPVLVCLTFADKLYAEHMKDAKYLTDESKYPGKISTKQKLQAELAVSYDDTAHLNSGFNSLFPATVYLYNHIYDHFTCNKR